MRTVPSADEEIVLEWLRAFNRRDLDGMLARLHRDVSLHPLRVNGMAASYQGHGGVKRWFAELSELQRPHRISLADVTDLKDGRLLATGTVGAEHPGCTPFSGIYELDGGMIVAAYHYFTPAETLRRIGIIPLG